LENGLSKHTQRNDLNDMGIFDVGFDNLKHRKFALYGASKGGELVLDYFKKISLEENVICFIDSDEKKQGKTFHDRKIHPIEFLKRNPQISIVISSQFVKEIYNALIKNECRNDVFTSLYYCMHTFYNMAPRYLINNKRFDVDISYIKTFYDSQDKYTDLIIQNFHYAHTSHNYCAIQPIEKTMKLLPVFKYWYAEEISLMTYQELTMCDAGAYVGDTLEEWVQCYGEKIKSYHGFEPEKLQFQELSRKIDQLGLKEKSIIYPVGLGNQNISLRFIENGEGSRIADEGNVIVETARLDDLNINVIGKLCIKMDIEGFELNALSGAQETIKKYKPELAVCIYHKLEDIYKIPEYIKQLVPEYNCVIRGGAHMVCYARASE
jgi:FkbM family methyltransferase